MIIRIVIDVNTHENIPPMGIKEILAMDLEKYGDTKVIKVEQLTDKKEKTYYDKNT